MGTAWGIKLLAALPGDWTVIGMVFNVPGHVRNYALAFGIAGLVGGVLLFINHKRRVNEVLASDASERVKTFETRKYRRRTVVSAMVASAGCMLAALYWVTDAKVFSAFILMILTLLVGILGVALFDLFSVGLHQIATPDEASQKAMIEDYLRKREEQADGAEGKEEAEQ
jgi:hypothetical protein